MFFLAMLAFSGAHNFGVQMTDCGNKFFVYDNDFDGADEEIQTFEREGAAGDNSKKNMLYERVQQSLFFEDAFSRTRVIYYRRLPSGKNLFWDKQEKTLLSLTEDDLDKIHIGAYKYLRASDVESEGVIFLEG